LNRWEVAGESGGIELREEKRREEREKDWGDLGMEEWNGKRGLEGLHGA
jgi:hypothetical protein